MEIIDYQVGNTANGETIKRIIHTSSIAVVCLTEGDAILFCYSKSDLSIKNSGDVIHKFQQLDSLILYELPTGVLRTLKHELGAALFSALTSTNDEANLKCFDIIESRIKSVKTTEEAKSILIISAFLMIFIIMFICVLFQQYEVLGQKQLYLCMALGSCGSFFSLLNRNSVIKVNLIDGIDYIHIQAFIISITGALSGLVIYIFSNANIAFGFVDGNYFALLAICLAAGFSERLVPDLFGKVEIKD